MTYSSRGTACRTKAMARVSISFTHTGARCWRRPMDRAARRGWRGGRADWTAPSPSRVWKPRGAGSGAARVPVHRAPPAPIHSRGCGRSRSSGDADRARVPGNSSELHVHVHLQDRATPSMAEGIPFHFRDYLVNRSQIVRGMPRGGRARTRRAEPAVSLAPSLSTFRLPNEQWECRS